MNDPLRVAVSYPYKGTINTFYDTTCDIKLAQNEVIMKDQPYDVFTREEKKLTFLTIENVTPTVETNLAAYTRHIIDDILLLFVDDETE